MTDFIDFALYSRFVWFVCCRSAAAAAAERLISRDADGQEVFEVLTQKVLNNYIHIGPLAPIVPNMILLLLFHLALAPLVLSQQLAVSPTT